METEFLHDVPNVLYKYRDWSNENHKKLLLDRELYFSSIDQFNDPFDGRVPYRYNPADLTEEKIFSKLYQLAKQSHTEWTEEQILQDCHEYQRKNLLHDEEHIEEFQKNTLKSLNELFGIVCLCKEKTNFLLWSHYANSHKGFCIGLNKRLLFDDTRAAFGHMNYQEELPAIGLFEDAITTITKLIGTKSKVWEYENEYRLRKGNHARKIITLRKETIVEVVLGCQMEQNDKRQIIEFVSKEYPHAKIFDTKLSKAKYEIEFMQIK
ncbi:MAG TPA: DUF2971 domain-containing protein [Chitinophagales bacterium]